MRPVPVPPRGWSPGALSPWPGPSGTLSTCPGRCGAGPASPGSVKLVPSPRDLGYPGQREPPWDLWVSRGVWGELQEVCGVSQVPCGVFGGVSEVSHPPPGMSCVAWGVFWGCPRGVFGVS